jgi:adenylate cyclase
MISRSRAAGAIVPAALIAALSILHPSFMQRPERAAYDIILRSVSAVPPDGRVVVVDIDERSLQSVGQWPWRRSVIGQLVSNIRGAGAAAVALDVLLAEPERTPAGGESTDRTLASALGDGRVVLGYAMTFEPGGNAAPPCADRPLSLPIRYEREEDGEPFFAATNIICSLPQLAAAAGASGFLNAAPDSDGILRRVPLLLELNGRVYPSLALAAVAVATGAKPTALQVANLQAARLVLDDREIPLDGKSHLLVRYRGPKRTFPYVSAADIMTGRTAPDAFAGKVVFIGTTALGTREVVATPLDTLFAGVEVHATVADNLLRHDFFYRPAHAAILETIAVIVFAAIVAALVGRWGVARAAAAAALMTTGSWAGAAALLSKYGVFLSPLLPSLAAGTTLAVAAAAELVVERRRADRAVADTAMSRRMMIQSLLTLTETRDAETGKHSRRTSKSMRLLARELALNPSYRDYLTAERIELLAELAPIHDIGKVGIADRVLNKPGALTPEELTEMRRHPELGRDVIERAARDCGGADDAIIRLAKEIVYTHHEKWDGSGYPRGLRGEEIPIAGRLMAVVDVYDAAVTRRLYQSPSSHDDTVTLIARGRGTHFDPAVVDAFLSISGALSDTALAS